MIIFLLTSALLRALFPLGLITERMSGIPFV